jgi:hypothetical protein
MVDLVRALLNREPVVITGLVVAGLVILAGEFNVVLDEVALEAVLAPVVAAVIGRNFVTPVNDPRDVE